VKPHWTGGAVAAGAVLVAAYLPEEPAGRLVETTLLALACVVAFQAGILSQIPYEAFHAQAQEADYRFPAIVGLVWAFMVMTTESVVSKLIMGPPVVICLYLAGGLWCRSQTRARR
jgi:phosphatidylserine synthase